MRQIILLTTLGLVMMTSSVGYAFWGRGSKVTIQGSTTVLPIAQKAAEVFMEKHPETNITVRGGGSGTGIKALLDGTTDIASSSRPMKREEKEKVLATGRTVVEYKIAIDGLAIVVNPSNPVNGLTLQQVKEIFTGAVTNWSEVGGKDAKIVLVSRDTASGTYETFKELVLKGANPAPGALLQASNQAVLTTVAQTPTGIGYIGLGYLSESVKAVKVNGVMPTFETVKSGKYPVRRYLYLYTDGRSKKEATSFINFLLSPEGQKIVAEEGFIPLN